MSASDTGDDAPLVQFFSSVRNNDSASAPASRTVCVSNAASRAKTLCCMLPALTSANRQPLDTQCRGVDPVAKFQIIGGHQRLEYFEQMSRDRHLAHGIGDLAVLDPEAGRAAAVVAGHAIDPGTDQVGDVKSLFDVRDQLGRRRPPGFEMQIVR